MSFEGESRIPGLGGRAYSAEEERAFNVEEKERVRELERMFTTGEDPITGEPTMNVAALKTLDFIAGDGMKVKAQLAEAKRQLSIVMELLKTESDARARLSRELSVYKERARQLEETLKMIRRPAKWWQFWR